MELGNMQKATLHLILLEVKNGMPPIAWLPFKHSHFPLNRGDGRKSKMKLVSICNFGSSPSVHHLPMLEAFHITTMNKATTRMAHMPISSSFPSTLAMRILLILFFDQPSKTNQTFTCKTVISPFPSSRNGVV